MNKITHHHANLNNNIRELQRNKQHVTVVTLIKNAAKFKSKNQPCQTRKKVITGSYLYPASKRTTMTYCFYLLYCIFYRYLYSASHGISQIQASSEHFSYRKKLRLKARERQGEGSRENR